MKILKTIFPLSYRFKTSKKFFSSLLCYILIYILGCYIPLEFASLISSLYVFIGGGILMINYLLKNKDDNNETE